jgi:RNA polymerase sigma-70 factor (ECF subfamily)
MNHGTFQSGISSTEVYEVQIERIIKECLKGSEGAWKMLVDTYSKKIFNLAYRFSGTYEGAEDMTQEIFLKLHNSLSKYDFNKNFNAWILTLARNYLIDNYRKTKKEREKRDEFNEYIFAADAATGPEADVLREEKKKIVWQGFKSLSTDLRMAVILRDIQGKSYEEIAEVTEVPLGTVKSRVNRGRLQLAKILQSQKENSHGM